MFTDREIRLIKRFIFLLLPYSILRIGFYLYHLNIYKQFTQEEIFESLILGIRFDIAAICLLNIPVVLLAIFPIMKEKWDRLIFILINTAAFIMALDDYELFSFTGKRLSFDFFVITDDIIQQLPQLTLYYWYLPLVAILFGIGFYYLDKKLWTGKPKKVFWPVRVVTGILLLGLTFVGIRGGFQHKSINVQSAFVQGKNELGHLVLNSPYHFIRTLKNKPMKSLAYFKSDDEAKNLILNRRDFREDMQGISKANVVLIILESFSLEYMEKGYTPFLSELAKKSLFFKKHLANGRRSIEALPSLLCSLPALIDEPLSKSIYSGNKFVCMPQLLKEAGYTNYFFHAGSRGTMGFDSFTLANGFDKYFSREDYGTQDYDGTWGTFDGPYLKYVAEHISKMPAPFLAGVFTLSSHQPYSIPEIFKGKFPKGTLEIHESIGYTDFALKEFFEAIEKEEWFKNTLFVITSDHTSKLETKKYNNLIGRYRVPLLLYWPGVSPREESKITQHSDIPKTVMDFVGVSGEALPMTGVSVFSSDLGAALNYGGGSYFLIDSRGLTTLDKTLGEKFFAYDWENGEMSVSEGTDPLLRAYLQYFLNGLIKNNLSL